MSASIEVYNPMSAYNSAINKLEKNGIRATKQRRVLAKLIFDKGKRHISAENLFDEVKKKIESKSEKYNDIKGFINYEEIEQLIIFSKNISIFV